eukprot:SAG31_NODE_711_length_12665_cov_2.283225_11_plen_95_part_00
MNDKWLPRTSISYLIVSHETDIDTDVPVLNYYIAILEECSDVRTFWWRCKNLHTSKYSLYLPVLNLVPVWTDRAVRPHPSRHRTSSKFKFKFRT